MQYQAGTARTWVRFSLGASLLASLFTSSGHADAPPGRYTLPGDGTVYDTQTTLTWQQTPDGAERNWSNASSYCDALALTGGSWRLPSAKELLTLLDVSRSNPAIDPTAFPATPNGSYWTASEQVGNPGEKWFIYFVYGNLSWTNTDALNHVRCVR